jgi:hypothetical protein
MLKRLTPVVGAMLLTVATYAFAQEMRGDHPETYTVQKGDTLWDISAKFLDKPWLWPEIWQANPQVKNPHRIYPGDVLSLAYVNGQPRVEVAMDGPQVRAGEPVDTVPLSEIEPWLKHLTVIQQPKDWPYVVGLEEGHLLTSSGQVAYIRGMANAQPGQLVQIARPMSLYAMEDVKNGRRRGGVTPLDFRADRLMMPFTTWGPGDAPHQAWGKKLGYEMMLHSVAEVTRVQGDITVVLLRDENRDVHVGDRVLPLEEQPYCNCYMPHAPRALPEAAQILAVPDGLRWSGPRTVIALSVGSADGVDNGTVFSIWHDGEVRKDIVAHKSNHAAWADRIAMPDDYIGHVMVFRTFDKVSYGLVLDAIRPARVGDLIKHPDAVE